MIGLDCKFPADLNPRLMWILRKRWCGKPFCNLSYLSIRLGLHVVLLYWLFSYNGACVYSCQLKVVIALISYLNLYSTVKSVGLGTNVRAVSELNALLKSRDLNLKVKGLTFIYRRLQGNQNSSSLQLEVAYWLAMTQVA